MRGIQLDMTGQSLDLDYTFETDCRIFANDHGGFVICIQPAERESGAATSLSARLVKCPVTVSAYGGCVANTTWHNNVHPVYLNDSIYIDVNNSIYAYSTSLSVSERSQTIIFARDNGSIIAVDDSQGQERKS